MKLFEMGAPYNERKVFVSPANSREAGLRHSPFVFVHYMRIQVRNQITALKMETGQQCQPLLLTKQLPAFQDDLLAFFPAEKGVAESNLKIE